MAPEGPEEEEEEEEGALQGPPTCFKGQARSLEGNRYPEPGRHPRRALRLRWGPRPTNIPGSGFCVQGLGFRAFQSSSFG